PRRPRNRPSLFQDARADVDAAPAEADQAVELARVEMEALAEEAAGLVGDRLARVRDPAGDRRAVDAVELTDLLDVERVDDVEAKSIALVGRERANGVGERALERLGVARAEALD